LPKNLTIQTTALLRTVFPLLLFAFAALGLKAQQDSTKKWFGVFSINHSFLEKDHPSIKNFSCSRSDFAFGIQSTDKKGLNLLSDVGISSGRVSFFDHYADSSYYIGGSDSGYNRYGRDYEFDSRWFAVQFYENINVTLNKPSARFQILIGLGLGLNVYLGSRTKSDTYFSYSYPYYDEPEDYAKHQRKSKASQVFGINYDYYTFIIRSQIGFGLRLTELSKMNLTASYLVLNEATVGMRDYKLKDSFAVAISYSIRLVTPK
jgi:hypothetical protein